jgi:virginiamycin B lyase
VGISVWNLGIIPSVLALLLSTFISCPIAYASTNPPKEWVIQTADSGILDITVYNGLVYFTESRGNKIGRIDPLTGNITEWPVPTADSSPTSIAASDGLIYFIEAKSHKIGCLNLSTGLITDKLVPVSESSESSPIILQGIAIDRGKVYFAYHLDNKIGCLDTSNGTFDQWNITTPNSRPGSLAFYDGFIYFIEYNSHKICRLDVLNGTFAEWTLSQPGAINIAVYNGLVYFTKHGDNSTGGKIGRLNPKTGNITEWLVPITNSQPTGITVYNGLVYFTEESGNGIGRLDPKTGKFVEWMIPTEESIPIGITVYNGLVYFTESRGNKIGFLTVEYGEWISIQTVPEGLPLMVDSTEYSEGDIFEWTKGSAHTFYAFESISPREGTRYVFSEWNDGSKTLSKSIIVTGPTTYIAIYRRQYYLTVLSDYGSTTGSGWYDEGTTAFAGIASGEVPAEFPYVNVFVVWGGDVQGKDLSNGPIVMDGPKVVIAQWERRFSSPFYILVWGLLIIAVGMTYFMSRKGEGPSDQLPPPEPVKQFRSEFHCPACGESFWLDGSMTKLPRCQECSAPNPVYLRTVEREDNTRP